MNHCFQGQKSPVNKGNSIVLEHEFYSWFFQADLNNLDDEDFANFRMRDNLFV